MINQRLLFNNFVLVCVSLTLRCVWSMPASQSIYPDGQFVSGGRPQALSLDQYKQLIQQQQQQQQQQQEYDAQGGKEQQLQYLRHQAAVSRPIYEQNSEAGGLQKYSTQIKQPIQPALYTTVENTQKLQQQPSVSALDYEQIQALHQQKRLQHQQQSLRLEQQQQQQQQVQQPQQIQRLQYPTQIKYASRPSQLHQQQQLAYRQQQQHSQQEQEQIGEPEDYEPNPSYQFGFDVNDDLYTNYQNRKEQRDGNKITGSYSVVDADGYIRTVKYTADPKDGFKAEVTREPTNIVVKIPKPDPQYTRQTQQSPHQYLQGIPPQQHQQLE